LLVDTAGAARVAQALGFDNATNYATRALGPLIGGATYQVLGITGIYALIALAYLVCLIMAARLGYRMEGGAAGRPVGGLLAALKVPRALILDRRFMVIMGVTLVYNLFCF